MVDAGSLTVDGQGERIGKPVLFVRRPVIPSPSLVRATAAGEKSNVLPSDRTSDNGYAIAVANCKYPSIQPPDKQLIHNLAITVTPRKA
jgi:hypothetical protein